MNNIFFLIFSKFSFFPEILKEILALSDLLGEVVERALDLIDNTHIKLYRSSHSRRELFEIKGSDRSYRLFPKLPYCNCRSFFKQVIQGDEYCCKHYIATRVGKALGKVEIIETPLLEFRKLLKKIQF